MDSHACLSIAKGNLILLAESFSLDLHSSVRCLALAYIAWTLQGGSLISHQLLAVDRHGNILTLETSDNWCCCKKGRTKHLLWWLRCREDRAPCQQFQLSVKAHMWKVLLIPADSVGCPPALPTLWLCPCPFQQAKQHLLPLHKGLLKQLKQQKVQLGIGWMD